MNRNDQNFIAQRIRTQYAEKQTPALDELKRLDNAVRRPADLFGYIFGSVSALVMGSGMSLVMTDLPETLGLANALPIGIAIGVVGLAMAILTYPIHRAILAGRRKKYASRVLALTDKILAE